MLRMEDGEWQNVEGMGLELLESLREPAEIGIIDAMMHLVEATKQTLEGTRSGRAYKVSKQGELHIASAPGEPPAVLFGQLYRSIAHSPPEWDNWTIASWIGSNVEYAQILEFGGIAGNGARILPRPYLEPTILREQDKVEQILEAALARATGG
jgi:phage gpG-like protein